MTDEHKFVAILIFASGERCQEERSWSSWGKDSDGRQVVEESWKVKE